MTSTSVVTTRDGDTVRMFQGVDGPFYRACNGNRCVNSVSYTHLTLPTSDLV